MKPFAISILMCLCLAANAKDRAIQEYTLDEHTVYSIPVAQDRVTTISFPGPISAIDAAQVTADPKRPAPFQIAHTKGSAFFSVRALTGRKVTNLNVRWNKKTYVLELVESAEPFLSVNFRYHSETGAAIAPITVTPSRLLALLDKAKAFPLLRAYYPATVAQVEYRNYEKDARVMDATNYTIQIVEAFRFNPEDTIIFRVQLKNKTETPMRFARDGFSLRVGDRTYPQSISDAGGSIPAKGEIPAYFAVTGTPNGGRNDISLKNDFYVILDVQPDKSAMEVEQ